MAVDKEYSNSPDKSRIATVFIAAIVIFFLTSSCHTLTEKDVFHLDTHPYTDYATLPTGGAICLEQGISEEWRFTMEDAIQFINEQKPNEARAETNYTLYQPNQIPSYLQNTICELTVRSVDEVPQPEYVLRDTTIKTTQLGEFFPENKLIELYGNNQSPELPLDYFWSHEEKINLSILIAFHEMGHARGLAHSLHPVMDGVTLTWRHASNPDLYSRDNRLLKESMRAIFWVNY